jgi:plastocyanin
VRNTSFARKPFAACCVWAAVALAAGPLAGQEKAVTAKIRIEKQSPTKSEKSHGSASDASEVVVWLVPLDSPAAKNVPLEQPGKRLQVVQKNKSFQPHLTVVRAGSVVDFPNHDPFFHNVFSLFDGKRFDLGLYEAGATNSVRFDHPGVSFLFCNIHPEMSAVVVAVDTPYYSVSNKSGGVTISNVPEGKYELHVWYERSQPDELKRLTRPVHISDDSRDLGTITVPQNSEFSPAHKNKYGQDYPPAPKEGYPHP